MYRVFFLALLSALFFPHEVRAENNPFSNQTFQNRLQQYLNANVVDKAFKTDKYLGVVKWCAFPSSSQKNNQNNEDILYVYCGVGVSDLVHPTQSFETVDRMSFKKIGGKKPLISGAIIKPVQQEIPFFEDKTGVKTLFVQLHLLVEIAVQNSSPPEEQAKPEQKKATRARVGKPVTMTWKLKNECPRGNLRVTLLAGEEVIGETDLQYNRKVKVPVKCYYGRESVCMVARLGDEGWTKCIPCKKSIAVDLTCTKPK